MTGKNNIIQSLTSSVPTGTFSPTASSLAGWDANSNISANSVLQGYTSTALGTNVTLTVSSAYMQIFTGTTSNSIITLPVTSTLVLGQQFLIMNLATGHVSTVTVETSGGNILGVVTDPNAPMLCTCVAITGTGIASWSSAQLVNSNAGNNISFGTSSGASYSTGTNNVAIGYQAAQTVSTGTNNISIGYQASQTSTTGSNNIILGQQAGYLSTGSNNIFIGLIAGQESAATNSIGIGDNSLASSTTIHPNTCVGHFSIDGANGAYNTTLGYQAGNNYASVESSNIIIGHAVVGVTNESNVLRIGPGTGTGNGFINTAYISGIQGIVVTGSPVLVSSSDQLGVASSSSQFKLDIKDMSEDSDISKLRPVTFVYNKDSAPGLKDATDNRQFGLIAEEVHEAFPYLCVYDEEGKPFSVKYHELPSILLNELQKSLKRIEALELQIRG